MCRRRGLVSGGGEAGEKIESTSARVWSMRRTSARTLSSTSWKAPWCQCGCPGSRRNASRRGADDTAAAAARRRSRRRKIGGPIMDDGSGETLGQGFWKLRRRSPLERERGRGRPKAEWGDGRGRAARRHQSPRRARSRRSSSWSLL